MSLITQLKNEKSSALIDGNKFKRDTLSFVIGEAQRVTKEPTDDQMYSIINKSIKGLKECVGLDLNAESQIALLQSYLPKQLSDQELIDVIQDLKSEGLNRGEIMKKLKETLAGRYDAKKASEFAK